MQTREKFNLGNETFAETGENLFGDFTAYRYKFVAVNGMEYETTGASLEICHKACKKWLRKHSVAFSGHRKLKGGEQELVGILQMVIHSLYHTGHRFFYTGGAVGFDMAAALAVLDFRRTHPDAVLVVVVPFREQNRRYGIQDKEKYGKILAEADRVLVLSESYYKNCYLERNDFMLENSSTLVAYWDGKTTGGTSYTYRKAMEKKTVSVLNIF